MSLLSLLNKTTHVSYLYRKMDWMGASTEVNTYLGLPLGTPWPFSIAHGVWPPRFQGSQDIVSTEPFHWSCSYSSYKTAESTKPTILAPHPWILTLENYLQSTTRLQNLNSKTDAPLIVGLPPSKTNDNQLYASLLRHGITAASILVKPRGPFARASETFWRSKGFKVYCASSFRELAAILSVHHTLYCPNASSIIFFASLQGLHVKLLGDVEWYSYEQQIDFPSSLESEQTLWDSWRAVLRLCASKDALFYESSEALGRSYLTTPQELSSKLSLFLETYLHLGPYLFSAVNRGPIRKSLYSLLANLHLSFPLLHLTGSFSTLRSKLHLSNSPASPLYLRKEHSIDHFLQNFPYENLAVVQPSRIAQAGFGADPSLIA